MQNACTKANGELTESGECIQIGEFDAAVYSEEIGNCNYAYNFCIENNGLVHNMSCCGPVFALLSILALAVWSSN